MAHEGPANGHGKPQRFDQSNLSMKRKSSLKPEMEERAASAFAVKSTFPGGDPMAATGGRAGT